MGTSLTGLTPSTTYDALIKVGDNGPLSATAKVLSDGLGNDSVLALSTTAVGIGTNAPGSILDINIPNTINTDLIRFSNSAGGSGDIAKFQYGPSGQFILNLLTNASANRPFGILNGNVGIGTSTPSQKLDVSGSPAIGINVASSASQAFMNFTSVNTAGFEPFIGFGGTTAGDQSQMIGIVNGGVRWTTAGTEKMRLTSDGYLRLASGTGGIQFNGDTAAANALDDYEEGTWTPTYRQDGTANTATYATRLGTYTKIGNLVTAFFDIDASSLTAGSGNCQVAGLPFTVSNSMAGFSFVSFRDPSVFVGTVTDVTFIGFAQKSDTYIMCRNISTTTGAESAQTSFASSGRVTGVVQYIA